MSSVKRILVVDDDVDFLISMRMQLRESYSVLTAGTVDEAMATLKEKDVDLVLLDVGLGRESGLDGIKMIHSVHPSVGVAMLSGRRDVNTVVAAIRAGAVDYLTKPVTTEQLTEVFEKAVASRTVQEKCEALMQSHMSQGNATSTIIYKSLPMQRLIRHADHVRGHGANVLIVGETGTGKELLARYVHECDGNGTRPFVAVNCAAIPENLLESELFGHEAGAFTGASRRRIGKFELADGGDIFLDEVSTMKLDLQVKLLRVLEERAFCRLGSNETIKSDFRVIAACNQSLDSLVENGSFRIDLYHRLRVVQLNMPPLRERIEDIPCLAEHFVKKFTVAGDEPKTISESAMAKFIDYTWPGNVRELSNVVQSIVIMSRGPVIDEKEFPTWVMNGCWQSMGAGASEEGLRLPAPSSVSMVTTLREYVQDAERKYIEHILMRNSDDRTRTAVALGIGRTTLYAKMKELGLMGKECVG
jgi:DNA-binding NtrC family response regulator